MINKNEVLGNLNMLASMPPSFINAANLKIAWDMRNQIKNELSEEELSSIDAKIEDMASKANVSMDDVKVNDTNASVVEAPELKQKPIKKVYTDKDLEVVTTRIANIDDKIKDKLSRIEELQEDKNTDPRLIQSYMNNLSDLYKERDVLGEQENLISTALSGGNIEGNAALRRTGRHFSEDDFNELYNQLDSFGYQNASGYNADKTLGKGVIRPTLENEIVNIRRINPDVIGTAVSILAQHYGSDFKNHKVTPEEIKELTYGKTGADPVLASPDQYGDIANYVNEVSNPQLYYALLNLPDILEAYKMRDRLLEDKKLAASELMVKARNADIENGGNGLGFLINDFYKELPDRYDTILSKLNERLDVLTSVKMSPEALKFAKDSNAIKGARKSYDRLTSYNINEMRDATDAYLRKPLVDEATEFNNLRNYLGIDSDATLPSKDDTLIKVRVFATSQDISEQRVRCIVSVIDKTSEQKVANLTAEDLGVNKPDERWKLKNPAMYAKQAEQYSDAEARAKQINSVKDAHGGNSRYTNTSPYDRDKINIYNPQLPEIGEPYKDTGSTDIGSEGNLEFGFEQPPAPKRRVSGKNKGGKK